MALREPRETEEPTASLVTVEPQDRLELQEALDLKDPKVKGELL